MTRTKTIRRILPRDTVIHDERLRALLAIDARMPRARAVAEVKRCAERERLFPELRRH